MNKESSSNLITPDTSTIGGRIKALRMKRGISQAVLADRLVINKSVVSRWESGQRIPCEDVVKQIADVFEVSPDYISFGNDHRENNDYLYLGGLSFHQIAVIRAIVDIIRECVSVRRN